MINAEGIISETEMEGDQHPRKRKDNIVNCRILNKE